MKNSMVEPCKPKLKKSNEKCFHVTLISARARHMADAEKESIFVLVKV